MTRSYTRPIILYADDAVLLNRHKEDENIEETIKNDMSKILSFFEMRKFIMNESKTVLMIFTTTHQQHQIDKIKLTELCTIERVDTFKYLGLYIDSNLKYDFHTKAIEKKIASSVGALWKMGSKIPCICANLAKHYTIFNLSVLEVQREELISWENRMQKNSHEKKHILVLIFSMRYQRILDNQQRNINLDTNLKKKFFLKKFWMSNFWMKILWVIFLRWTFNCLNIFFIHLDIRSNLIWIP